MAGLGITAGAHRLWSHRSYKARLPLRILLAVFNCMALQVRVCVGHVTCGVYVGNMPLFGLLLIRKAHAIQERGQ